MSTPDPESLEASAYFRTRGAFDPRREALWRHLTPYLARFIPEHAEVLELGAGHCYFINRVNAPRRVAVDHAPEVSQWAATGVEAVVSDALEFLRGVEPGQFDFILASNFLEHFSWPALQTMIELIVRALSPRGRLALIQPNFRLEPGRYFDDYTHRTIFTDVSLSDWLESNQLQIVKVVPRFLPSTVKSRVGHFAFLIPLYLRLPWRPLAGQMFVLAQHAPGRHETVRQT